MHKIISYGIVKNENGFIQSLMSEEEYYSWKSENIIHKDFLAPYLILLPLLQRERDYPAKKWRRFEQLLKRDVRRSKHGEIVFYNISHEHFGLCFLFGWIAIKKNISTDMELSCDERVLQRLGTKIRADYSTSLL